MSQVDEGPHRPADDSEEIYFEGSPLLRGELMFAGLWFIIGLALIVAPFIAHAPIGIAAVLVILGIIAMLVPIIRTRTMRYRVSNYRIDYARGILRRKIDTLELWHVEDISFEQSLLGRMLGVGTIKIISHDDTTPLLVLRGIPTPLPLFETLKQRIIAVKRQRGVIKMDTGN